MTQTPTLLPDSLFSSRSFAWSIAAASAFCLLGCGEEGSGIIVEKSRSLEAYDRISVEDGFEVSVIMGDEYRLRVWVDDNLVDYVRVNQEGDEVHLDMDDAWFHHATLRAEFTLPELAGVELQDGSEFSAEDLVLAKNLSLSTEDGSRLELIAREDEQLENLNISSSDGSQILAHAEAQATIAEVKDGSEVILNGKGTLLDAEVRDGASFQAKLFPVEQFSFHGSDGAELTATVNREARGELSDGSRLTLYGAAELEADVNDASEIDRK